MKNLLTATLLAVFALLLPSYISEKPVSEVSKSLVFPVAGKKSKIGSFWGDVRDGGRRKHRGIDIFAKKGTPLLAISDGVVTSVGEGPVSGKTVWLRSSDHPLTAYYAHLDQQKVKVGQRVKKGDVIGTVGKTGNARTTPPHLHFGIYTNSGAVNPLPYVKSAAKIAAPVSPPNKVAAKKPASKPAPKAVMQASFPKKYIWKTIRVNADPSAKYYVTTRSNVVRFYKGQTQLIGRYTKSSGTKYPYRITMGEKHLNVSGSGAIVSASGQKVGEVI